MAKEILMTVVFPSGGGGHWLLSLINGINKHRNGDVLLYNSRQEIVNDLIQQREFFCNFTQGQIINV